MGELRGLVPDWPSKRVPHLLAELPESRMGQVESTCLRSLPGAAVAD